MTVLAGMYPGETCWVIGKGPSLLQLRAEHIGPGPVIVLNQAIVEVRPLALPNPTYSMQKDGCIPGHGGNLRHPPEPGHECSDELDPTLPGETLLLSTRESANCLPQCSPRIVLDIEAEFGRSWHLPSAPVSLLLAMDMGCARVVFVCCDAWINRDLRRIYRGRLIDTPDFGYIASAQMSVDIADEAGFPISWLIPE